MKNEKHTVTMRPNKTDRNKYDVILIDEDNQTIKVYVEGVDYRTARTSLSENT